MENDYVCPTDWKAKCPILGTCLYRLLVAVGTWAPSLVKMGT